MPDAWAMDEAGKAYVTGRAGQLGAPGGYATARYDPDGLLLWRSFSDQPLPGEMRPTLALANVSLSQAGYYWVEVSDRQGTVASTAARLTVNAAPALWDQPSGQSLLVGETAQLIVAAEGTLPLAVQWYCDGVALPGATSHWLILRNVQIAQAGGYRAAVRNEFGSVTSRVAFVSVATPLAPTGSIPADLEGGVAASATLGVCVTGASGTARLDAQGASRWRTKQATGVAAAIGAQNQIVVTGPEGTTALDAEGRTLWAIPSARRVAVALDSVGNVHLARSGTYSPVEADFITEKLDPSGQRLWFMRYDSRYDCVPHALMADRDGDLLSSCARRAQAYENTFAKSAVSPVTGSLAVPR